MYRATKDIMLPTTITGSLPRPSWYTENLGTRMFLDADGQPPLPRAIHRYAVLLSARAGARRARHLHRRRLPLRRRRRRAKLDQLSAASHDAATSAAIRGRRRPGRGGLWFPRGHILHDYLESRVMPVIIGPVGRGDLQYTALWKAAQRLTTRPVKFGAVSAEIVAFASQDKYYKSVPDRMLAIADAFNEEYNELADAGCPVIQIEEPQIHLAAARGIQDKVIDAGIDGRGVQPHGEGIARQDRSVGAFLLGQSVAAAHVRQGAELQAVAGDLQQSRRRRDHLRILKLRRHGPGGDRQDHHRTRRSPSASSTITPCRWKVRTRWRRKSATRSNTSRRSGW